MGELLASFPFVRARKIEYLTRGLKVAFEVYCLYHQGLQLFLLKVDLNFPLLRVASCILIPASAYF